MKKHFFKIFCVTAIVIALATLFEPSRAYFFDKAKIQKELEAKKNEKDSIVKVFENIRNNPNDLERSARNSGYAKRGETMLKIVSVNEEEEMRKLKISAFLLLSLTIIIGLIVLFAIPKKAVKIDEKSSQE